MLIKYDLDGAHLKACKHIVPVVEMTHVIISITCVLLNNQTRVTLNVTRVFQITHVFTSEIEVTSET